MEKLKYSGHIVLEVGDRKIEGKNVITHLFEEVVATVGIDRLFTRSNPYSEGQTFIQSGAGRTDYGYNQFYNDNSGQMLLTVYLLNLSSAEKSALNSNSNVLPVYTSDFLTVDSNKVVGWATGRIAPVAASKEGHTARLSGVNLLNQRKHAIQWVFESGAVAGTFNTIAVGINVIELNSCAGVRLARVIDDACAAASDYSNLGQYFMIPDVKSEDGTVVFTGANEMLLGGVTSSDYQVARRVLNLQTGEIETLDVNDNRYDLPLYSASMNGEAGAANQFVFGDYICRNYYQGSRYNYVEYTNIKTKAVNSVNAQRARGAFTYNGYCYVVGQSDSTHVAAYAYNSSFTAVSSANLNIAIPTGLNASYCKIMNYGSNYILVYNDYDFGDATRAKTFIFTDPTDIEGSIIGILPGLQPICTFQYSGNHYFMYTDGNNIYNAEEKQNCRYYHNGSTYDNAHYGLKFCSTNMFGNLFSFKTYDDQTVESGQPVKVQYIYTFDE